MVPASFDGWFRAKWRGRWRHSFWGVPGSPGRSDSGWSPERFPFVPNLIEHVFENTCFFTDNRKRVQKKIDFLLHG